MSSTKILKGLLILGITVFILTIIGCIYLIIWADTFWWIALSPMIMCIALAIWAVDLLSTIIKEQNNDKH